MKSKETFLQEMAIDHLTIHSDETEQSLKSKTPKELFFMVYRSVQDVIEERERARNLQDFDAFQLADEKLWRYGHALITFAIAESLGWMKNFKPVQDEATQYRIVVPYGVKFSCGMSVVKDAMLNLNTGELEKWIEIPVYAIQGDSPIGEFVYLFTNDPYFQIEKEVRTVEGRKILYPPFTTEERNLVAVSSHQEMLNPFI